jgi:hypothetical protein
LAPPSPTAAAPTVEYDATSRAASVRELRWVLPGRPYDCDPDPQPRRPSFDSMLICAAPVHENYSGSQDWTATTGLGVLPASMVVPGNLQRTADRLFGSLRGQFFADQETQVRKLAAQRFDRAPAGKALAVSGEVHYAVAGVPSRYDRLVVLVVELADGGYGAWFSSRPDDTPAGTLKALDDSIASLTAQ